MNSRAPHTRFVVRWSFTLLVAAAASCLAFCGAAHAGVTYDQVVLGDNPTAYWRFEETSTAQPAADSATADGAQNGTYGTVGAGSVSLVPGTVGSAVLFTSPSSTAGGYVVASGVNMTNAFSVELWARSTTETWDAWGWLASSREPNGFIVHPRLASPGTKTWDGYVVNNAGAFTQIGSHTPADIQGWHHYALTYDGTTARMYFDGIQVASRTGTIARDTVDPNGITVYLGRDYTMGDRFGNGAIDEAAVFTSALTAAQVRRHYSAAYGAYAFNGPDSPALDFQGHFVYSVDVGNASSGSIGKIGDAVFTGQNVPGVSLSYGTLLTTWATRPEYGNTPEANLLETMMHSIVYTSSGTNPTVKVELDVVPGTYQLQLLFSENDVFSSPMVGRSFDILVDGKKLFDDFSTAAMVGPVPQQSIPNLGVVFSTIVRTAGNKLTIELVGETAIPNNYNHPILNAFTLELVPEPSSLVILGLGVALLAPAGLRLRRRRGTRG